MKNNLTFHLRHFLSINFFILCTSLVFSQSPEGFNYQSVLRDSDGKLITNTTVGLLFQIRQNSTTGSIVYSETHNTLTTNSGVASVVIGNGTTTDNFSNINWASYTYFLEISADPTNSDNFTTLGTQQLMSVPYALHSKTAENLTQPITAGDGISITDNEISVADLNVLNAKTIVAKGNTTAINNTSLNGGEGIIVPGTASDYNISVQDGNGRIQHKWNATVGLAEKFISGAEDAAFIDITANVANDNDAWIEFKHADGASATAGDPISWKTQMVINQAGEVGINETSPDDMLHVTSGGNGTRVRTENIGNGWAGLVAKNTIGEMFMGIQGAFDATPGEFHFYDNVAGERRMVIDANGNFGIGVDDPTVKLDVNGAVNCTGGTCSSDMRWKKEITPLTNTLSKISQIRGVSYYWRTDKFKHKAFTDDKQIGVIAQEVEKVYPELVKTDKDGFKSMDYMSLTAVLLEAVKAQQDEIEVLKNKLEKVDQLEIMVAKLLKK